MKTSFIIILLISLNLNANELSWVNEQIKAIKPPRHGISESRINRTKNPFIFFKTKEEKIPTKKTIVNVKKTLTNTNVVSKKSTSIILSAIINKSALVNGKWYKVNDKIGKYTLSKINKTTAILKYKRKELLLSTQTKNKNLKFKND